MEPFAQPRDVSVIWHHPLTDAEFITVESRIDQASQQVRDEVPTVDDRIADGSLAAVTVKFIVRDMVYRLVSHPDYVRQQSVSIDDGNKSVTYDASVSKGQMFITDAELARLLGSASAVGGSAFEIVLG